MIRDVVFAGVRVQARASGALYWPQCDTLIVADLHLGKSARMAARGGALLPPHETTDTLARLEAELHALNPARVISLGDAFEDALAPDALRPEDTSRLAAMARGRDWLWITGNHDAAAVPGFGHVADEITEHGLTLRHIAGNGPDISGHYHPKARLAGRARPAFLIGAEHLVLPAFGTYTGGLDCGAEPLASLVGPGLALLTGPRLLACPLTRPTTRPMTRPLRPNDRKQRV